MPPCLPRSTQRAGVQVNLIYDSVDSLFTPKQFFQQLVDVGANMLEYNPINPLQTRKVWQLNERDHRKLLVVDGRIAYVGGINISSVYSFGSFGSSFGHRTDDNKSQQKKDGLTWRDTHLRIEGPAVVKFQRLCSWLPGKSRRAINMERGVGRAIGNSPSDPYSLMYVILISVINSEESRVYLTNAYFLSDPQLLAALKDAAARGVDVRLLLSGKSDSDLAHQASCPFYDELLRNGIKVYERQNVLLHARTATIDGVWSTVGSINLDWRSRLNNQEIDAVMLGQDSGSRMQTLFEQDLQASKQITLKDWRNRSLILHIKEKWARLL